MSFHDRNGCTADPERGLDIDAHAAPKIVVRGVRDLAARDDPRVVYHNVQSAQPRIGQGGKRVAKRAIQLSSHLNNIFEHDCEDLQFSIACAEKGDSKSISKDPTLNPICHHQILNSLKTDFSLQCPQRIDLLARRLVPEIDSIPVKPLPTSDASLKDPIGKIDISIV